YTKGLGTAVTLFSRVPNSDSLDTQDIVISYTAGFISMLRICERLDIPAKTALILARRNYLLGGRTVLRLFRENTDLESGVIESAARNYPANPEEFLSNYRDTVQRLLNDEKYKDFL